MKKILIAGKNSFIGTSFEKYINENYSSDYQINTVDLLDPQWNKQSFAGYNVVFHVAGIAHSDNGKISREKEKLYRSVNTDLTIKVAQKAKKDGVEQFIFMSSAIVYGDSAPIGKKKIIYNDTEPNPKNCYGDSKLQAEKGLLLLDDKDFKVCILRPPMIYGKGGKGNFPILEKISKKTFIFPYVKNERSMLYIGNLVEFVRLVIKNSDAGIYHPQNNEYSNTSELIKMIAKERGRKIILFKGFTFFLKILSLFFGVITKAFGNMIYDKSISEYNEEYCKYSLNESIEQMVK